MGWRLLVLLGLALAGCEKKPAPPAAPAAPAASASGPRAKLLARIGNINDPNTPCPLVSLAEFFEGNNDPGSIGYNLPDSPSPQEWYELLKQIAERPEVRDVRIQVMDLEDPDGWPSTDTIWIITTASSKEVRGWLPKRIAPDDVIEGFPKSGSPVEAYEVPPGYMAVGLWYD